MNTVLQAFAHIVPLHRGLLHLDLSLHICPRRKHLGVLLLNKYAH